MLSIELGDPCRSSALAFVKAMMKMQADIANPRIVFRYSHPARLYFCKKKKSSWPGKDP